jgi:hypothetical protein
MPIASHPRHAPYKRPIRRCADPEHHARFLALLARHKGQDDAYVIVPAEFHHLLLTSQLIRCHMTRLLIQIAAKSC